MKGRAEDELVAVASAWDRAMIGNDPDEIGFYMADDWIIVGPDGRIGDKTTFLQLVRTGALSHDVMTTEDPQVRVYGGTAVVTARGVSAGQYQGTPFHDVERASSVFVKQDGQWRCVLTHLSRLAPD